VEKKDKNYGKNGEIIINGDSCGKRIKEKIYAPCIYAE